MEEGLVSWWSPQTWGNRKAGLELSDLSIPPAFLSGWEAKLAEGSRP